jgi:hypothetical protein
MLFLFPDFLDSQNFNDRQGSMSSLRNIFLSCCVVCLIAVRAQAQVVTGISDGVFGCLENNGIYSIVRFDSDSSYFAVDATQTLNRIRTRLSSLRRQKKDARDQGKTALVNTLTTRILTFRSRREGITTCLAANPATGSAADACAIIGNNGSFIPRIIHGARCTPGDSPVVQVFTLDDEGVVDGLCSGTAVRENVILTAAHCLVDGVAGIRIDAPEDSLDSYDFHSHPSYLVNDSLSQEAFDVGLVILPRALQGVRTANMLAHDDLVHGERALIAGFGVNENDVSGILRAGFMNIDSTDSTGIVAQYTGVDSNTCSGDSGGPLLVQRGDEWQIAGLTSWGILDQCGVGDTSYFANINDPSVRNFFESIVPGL